MKNVSTSLALLVPVVFAMLAMSCDWSSGSGDNNFNTANGSSVSNISGVYQGRLGGGRAVSNPTRGNITSLTVQQSGNRVEVVDNQGSSYTGSVGAPLLLTGGDSEQIPSGASLATYQISFSGKDGVAALDVDFTGVITLVAVSNINSDTRTISDDSTSSSTTTNTFTATNTVPEQVGVDGVEPGSTESTTSTNTDTSSSTDNSTVVRDFSLTDSTTQLLLRGTWVEVGGRVSSVEALAAGIVGNLSFTEGSGTGGTGTTTTL